jgi:hypothetical protein
MITPILNGIWMRESVGYPPHLDYMCINAERGRIVSFVAHVDRKLYHLPLRNWFAVTSPGTIRESREPDRGWMEHGFRFDGDRLVWIVLGQDRVWEHLPTENAPEWLEAKLKIAYSRMDEAERAVGAQDRPTGSTGVVPPG